MPKRSINVFDTVKMRRRGVSKALKKDLNDAARQQFVSELQELWDRAHRIGLHATAHSLHTAIQVVGYEIAGDAKAIEKINEGKRP